MQQTCGQDRKCSSEAASQLRALKKDPAKSAKMIDLRYVSDSITGIERSKHGSTFRYRFKGDPVKDPEILQRIIPFGIRGSTKGGWQF